MDDFFRIAADVQALEVRALLSVTVASNFVGLDFNSSGGYIPPDTCGAAGPSSYVETVNQTVAIYTTKVSSSPAVTSSLSSFLFGAGGLPTADFGSGLSDPIVTYDEHIGRFIIGDQDVDFNTHISNFDIAVSKTSRPGSLTSADWNFYSISTTEAGFDADYPGNFGYNHDAFVFTLNMFGVSGGAHVRVESVNASDLANGVAPAALNAFSNDVAGFSFRPTTMHDSVAGDPMWLIAEHGDDQSIDVIKMTGVLSNAASFSTTTLSVTPYTFIASPLNPDSTVVVYNIDSRILKAAESNNNIVATHAVGVGGNEDVAQWYRIDVSSGTPVLADQGQVSAGPNTYIYYPGIDINSAGQIGMSFMRSGTDSGADFMSMYVTGRNPSDPAGTMLAPVLVAAGTGQTNYSDFGFRAGDLSGINVDPIDGSFWAANEFANSEANANWGTAIANFSPGITLNAPQNVTATPLPPTQARVTWSPVAGADGYRIFLYNPTTHRNTKLLATVGPTVTTTVVSGLAPATKQYLVVEAFSNTLSPSTADSTPVAVTEPLTAPSLRVTVLSTTTALVSWAPVPAAQGYRIYAMIGGKQVLLGTLKATAKSVTLVGLKHGSTIQILVEAFNGGVVADSNWVSVTT